jgi:putative redox protein
MKVKVVQKEDFHFVGIGEAGREVPIDAAGYVGGKGRGIRPPELLFHSIAGCVEYTSMKPFTKRANTRST